MRRGGQRVDVGRHGAEREQRDQHPEQRAADLAAPGEETRQPGQYENAHVRPVERAVVFQAHPEQLRHPDRHRGADRAEDQCPQVPARPGVHGPVTGEHQLFPQPFRVLPGELAGELVEAAHPFHRDQERLVRAQPGRDERVDGAAQVVLQLVGVGLRQLAAALHVAPPLRELRLQLDGAVRCGHARPSSGIAGSVPRSCGSSQMSRSAPTTVSHWRRCSASSARPLSVMR